MCADVSPRPGPRNWDADLSAEHDSPQELAEGADRSTVGALSVSAGTASRNEPRRKDTLRVERTGCNWSARRAAVLSVPPVGQGRHSATIAGGICSLSSDPRRSQVPPGSCRAQSPAHRCRVLPGSCRSRPRVRDRDCSSTEIVLSRCWPCGSESPRAAPPISSP